MNKQISLFEIEQESSYEWNHLYDSIKKEDWIKYCKEHRYGNYIDDLLFDYVLNYCTSSIAHYTYINQGYEDIEQILGLINVEVHQICRTQTFHHSSESLTIYSIKTSNEDYDIFIQLGDNVLIRKQIDNPFDRFRLPNMYYVIYNKNKKEYIIMPDEKEKIVEGYFKIREIALNDEESINMIEFKISDIINLLKGAAE